MKRDQYIKHLMDLGVPRKKAEAMANGCIMQARPFALDFHRREPWLRLRYAGIEVCEYIGAAFYAATRRWRRK